MLSISVSSKEVMRVRTAICSAEHLTFLPNLLFKRSAFLIMSVLSFGGEIFPMGKSVTYSYLILEVHVLNMLQYDIYVV